MTDLINLPNPQPLLPSLLETGFSHEIAAAASQSYQQRAEEFKRRTEMMLIAAMRRIATLPPCASAASLNPLSRKDLSSFTQTYLRCLEEWKEEMVQLLKQASPKVPSKAAPQRNSRSFNHECLPLLERFFDENPFPTHADKVFLAKQSNMQYRQIHVWFQNRRNRTKREGESSREKRISQGSTKSLDKPYERMKGHVVKPASQLHKSSPVRPAVSDDKMRTTRNNAQAYVFTSPPPPHAFPSPYPPPCTYDPFPCKSGSLSFGKPEWKRAPCLKPPPSVPFSIDDLVDKLSQLTVRGDTHVKESPCSRAYAATAAITVIPSRAPHPSLVVHRQSEFAHVKVHNASAQASALRSCNLQVPRRTSNPIPIPVLRPLCKGDPPAKRKTVPLPHGQHFPARMHTNKRDATPSECSSTSSSSRMFSASSGSRRCSFSSVNFSPTNTASVQELARSPS